MCCVMPIFVCMFGTKNVLEVSNLIEDNYDQEEQGADLVKEKVAAVE